MQLKIKTSPDPLTADQLLVISHKKLVEIIRQPSYIHTKGANYDPLECGPSDLMLEAAKRIEMLDEVCTFYIAIVNALATDSPLTDNQRVDMLKRVPEMCLDNIVARHNKDLANAV